MQIADSKNQTERKRVALVSRLSILVFVLTAFYIFLDWLFEIHVQSFIYAGFLTSSLVTFILARTRQAQAAKAVGLLAFNSLIFVVASSEPFETGIHLYLFAAAAVALTIYGFEDWPKSFFFAALSTALLILVYLGDISLIEHRDFSHEKARIFFVINAIVNASVCISSFLLFSRVNYQAEKNLRENEKRMLEQNGQLMKANKELDRFVYSVSHDLRAPLSSISGLIQLIEKSSENKDTIQYLGLMKGRIARLEQFIRDIIDFSRNERTNTSLEKVNVCDLVNETFEGLKFIPGADRVHLENGLQPAEVVSLDRTRFEMVLSNLISNAIHYRNKNKDVSFLRFSSQWNQGYLRIFIDDNGIGIDPAHQPKVFNMFYRATENSKGSGLGLYIAKEAVAKMGGTITLHSVVGEGTRFALELPTERNLVSANILREELVNK